MPLQTQDLVMIALGVLGDRPPNNEQPRLVDGIHLRWAFKREKGFPRYGYYLFRRVHQPNATEYRLSDALKPLQPGGLSQRLLAVSFGLVSGQVSSDQDLMLTDDFLPTDLVELDLSHRHHLRFDLTPGIVARKVTVRIGFREGFATTDEIQVIAFHSTPERGEVAVGQVRAKGAAGKEGTYSLASDAISGIIMSSGAAALVDLSVMPVTLADHWELVPDCPEPICLPVTHQDYPCREGDLNPQADQEEALSRIRYGSRDDWADQENQDPPRKPFTELYDRLIDLVKGGSQPSMAERKTEYQKGVADPPEPEVQIPKMPKLYPLDLVLLGSLHPAVAQMLGLYWVDRTAQKDTAYDYLIIADDEGYVRLEAKGDILGPLLNDPEQVLQHLDSYVIFNKTLAPAPALSAPENLQVYALAGGSIRTQGGAISDATNSAGLRWDRGVTNTGALLPGRPVMYHVWRSSLGETPDAEGSYELITRGQPVVVAEVKREDSSAIPIPQYASNWPPFPLHYLDMGLPEGWYRYQVNGIDIFGRHSPNSAAAVWYEWAPMPEPRPWYYKDPPGKTVVHPSAVLLLDKLPPPPPTGIEAYALDPRDATVLRDQAYQAWYRALSDEDWYKSLSEQDKQNLIGLRVRWQWPELFRRQAPDTREFRLYFHPARLNAEPGNTTSVSAESNALSVVDTDIPTTQPAGAYKGAVLQIGADFFPIVDSEAVYPLRLHVKNAGVLSPSQTVAVNNGSATITGTATRWGTELIGMLLQIAGEPATYTIVTVDSPTKLTLDQAYAGTSGSGKSFTVFDVRPRAPAPCTITIPSSSVIASAGKISLTSGSSTVTGEGTDWNTDHTGSLLRIEGEITSYRVKRVDSPTQLTLDRTYMQATTTTGKIYTLNRPHPLFTDFSVARNWKERYYVVGYNDHVTESFTLASDPSGQALEGKVATVSGTTSAGTALSLDGTPDLSEFWLTGQHLLLFQDPPHSGTMHPILGIDNAAKTVTVEGTPDLRAAPNKWQIGWPLRRYEVFLPAPGDTFHEGLPLLTPLERPIDYAHIGVSAADGRTHTADAPQWAARRWGNRFGNEGPVGTPVMIFCVRRERPPAPKPPPDSERVYASRPDYHGHSFYTYRWRPGENLKTHIFRALDDTLFQVDWFIRTTRGALDPLNRQHEVIFSALPEDWSPERKQAAADQLNAIASIEDYAGLSQDAWDFMAFLPGNESVKGMNALQQRDWKIRASRTSLSENSVDYFPDEWKPNPTDDPQVQQVKQQRLQNIATMLNSITSTTAYAALSNDALRILAGLPGNERAFTQLTIQPFDPEEREKDDPSLLRWRNRVGPDNEADFAVDQALRAYIDTLDGRSTNRYFYRAAYVDSVHNRSDLSLSSPPVWLYKVVPPRSPVITKVLGGDRQITLWWASNREPDLVEYRVYRADNEQAARDLRLMALVHTESVPSGDPAKRRAEVEWTDRPVAGLVTLYYRLVAMDDTGNVSAPSILAAARAFDEELPVPPPLTVTWVDIGNGVMRAQATWTSTEDTLLQRRKSGGAWWTSLEDWFLPGLHTVVDNATDAAQSYDYRLRVRKTTGAVAVGISVVLASLHE